MGYLHIANLYKDQSILLFKECYALEKVHGTSAHIRWENNTLHFFSGGMSHQLFKDIFPDHTKLTTELAALGHPSIGIYGEAYGGKEQGMKTTYGAIPNFIAFDVMVDEKWVDVPTAYELVTKLGLEFVPYEQGPAELSWLDGQRDADSIVAQRRGMGAGHHREGVVLRPLVEAYTAHGRIISKHKRPEFTETRTPRIVDPNQVAVLAEAQAIAFEWVTPMRLQHVLQHIPTPHEMNQTGAVIAAMLEDVLREAQGEIVDTPAARSAIGKAAAKLFKTHVTTIGS
jgi:hypothetical protein